MEPRGFWHCIRLLILLLTLLLLPLSAALANDRPLPDSEWTEEAKLTLAQALAGEGGSLDDARAMAWVLARRHELVGERQGWSFVDLVRRYCAPLRRDLPLTARRRRIQGLTWTSLNPALARLVERWGAGLEPDPCRGQADHWDSPTSAKRRGVRMRRVQCRGELYQAYFGV